MSAIRHPRAGVPGRSSSSPVTTIATRGRRTTSTGRAPRALRTPRSCGRRTRPARSTTRPGRDVLPAPADVPARGRRLEDPDGRAVGRGRLDLDDRVGPLGDARTRWRSRPPRPARPAPRRPARAGPGRRSAKHGRAVRRGAERLLAPDRIAVHRRAVERRDGFPGRRRRTRAHARPPRTARPARPPAVVTRTLDQLQHVRDRRPVAEPAHPGVVRTSGGRRPGRASWLSLIPRCVPLVLLPG